MNHDAEKQAIVHKIIRAYDPRLVQLYGMIRFLILNHRFLDEIGQYFPNSGLVLDVGCGFGMFAQYYATLFPQLRFRAIDINKRRIALAAAAAQKLRLDNVEFLVGDARQFHCPEPVEGVYMLDLIHHIPEEAVSRLIKSIVQQLHPGCRLILKDVETRPRLKLAYTWLLDKMMDYRAPLRYWSSSEVHQLLRTLGLRVYQHKMLHYLPSPHIVYIGVKEPDCAEVPVR